MNLKHSIISRIPSIFSKHKKAAIILLGLFVLVGGWLMWSTFKTTNTANTPVQTAPVKTGNLVVSVTSAGQVSSSNSQSINTNVSGVVKTVFVQNEQTVKAGEKIAELDLDQESQQAYTQALSSYQSAKNSAAAAQANLYSLQATMLGKWDTFKELSESDTYQDTSSDNRSLPEFHIPQKEWLAAEAQYKNQQSVVAQAQTALSSAAQALKLSSPIIYAPIAGKVSGLWLAPGTVLPAQTTSGDSSNSQTIANIRTDALPTVTVNLTEVDVTKVKINQAVSITIDALPDKTYTGQVISVDTVGSISSGVTSYPAVIAFDTQAPEIFANMSVQASIITTTKENVIVIPSSAVQTQKGTSVVKVMKDGQAISTPVELGISSGTQVEIVSGLREGDVIVISPVQSTTKNNSQTTSPFGGSSFGGGLGGGAPVRMSR